jgi:hypothetical protein
VTGGHILPFPAAATLLAQSPIEGAKIARKHMRWRYAGRVLVLLAAAVLAVTAMPQSKPDSPVLQPFTRKLGPFPVQGQPYYVVVHGRQLAWPKEANHKFDPDDEETTESFEITDATGQALYRRSIADETQPINPQEVVREKRFPFTTGLSVARFEGSGGSGLLLIWGDLPSAPDACGTYQFFAPRAGKLAPMSEPFCSEIDMEYPQSGPLLKLQRDTVTGADVFHEIVNTHRFRILVPVRVDFMRGQLLAAHHCRQLTSRGYEALCEFPVRAERIPLDEDTFLRLSAEPDSGQTPAHVIVHRNSKVEFLGAFTGYNFGDGKLEDNPWLKVRIDGKTGWIRDDEDLSAIGLPMIG